MDKKEIPTVAQQPCVKYASEFTEKEIQGVNSLHTSSSTSTQIGYCAKLDGHDDAVAKEESKKRIIEYLQTVINFLEVQTMFYKKEKTPNKLEFSTKDICNNKLYYNEFNLHYQNQSHFVVAE